VNKICLIVLFLSFFFLFLFSSSVFASSDTTPPTTSLLLNPPSPDGNNGWYKTPVEVTLNAVDLESGVKEINWRLNNGLWTKKSFTQTLNMVINSSFESDTEGWSFIPFNNSTGERTSELAKIDDYSIKINSLENGSSLFTNKQSYVVVSPWKTVSLGVWLKGSDVLGVGAFYKVYILTSTGEKLLYTSPVHNGTFDWIYELKDLVISSDSAYGLYFELILQGVGSAYFDGVYAAYASEQPQTSFTISDNGINTLEFYSVDFAGNIENTKSASFKVDTIAPTNWQNFETERAGDAHTLISRINVSDNASGLSATNPEFQYSPLYIWLWGYFTDYEECKGSFVSDGWLSAEPSFEDGDITGTLASPVINYCNSTWFLCKGVRFKVEDLAGNDSTKEICINGPWVKSVDGNVISLNSINMSSGSPEDNTNALVVSSQALSNFSSSKNWLVSYYPSRFNMVSYSYDDLFNKYSPDNTISSLPVTNGAFKTSGNFQVNAATIPRNYTTQQFSNVFFVNGNLVAQQDIDMKNTSGTIFVVKGDVLVDKNVSVLDGFFIVDGTFNTSYNGGFVNDPLKIFGGVFANTFELNRSFSAFKSQSDPAEEFIYDPKYLIDFTSFFGNVSIKWSEIFE